MKQTEKTAVGYIRVSSTRQAEEGISLEAQAEKIKAWAEYNGYTLLNVYKDAAKSGGKMTNRAGVKAAIDHASKSGAVLVAYSLSRFARSTADAANSLERLKRTGGGFVSLSEQIDTTTAAGRAFFAMLAMFAAFEREIAGERTASVLGHLKRQGKRYSARLPYGMALGSDGSTLIPDAKERQAIDRAKAMRADGLPLREVGERLQREGFKPRGGGRVWSPKVLAAIVSR